MEEENDFFHDQFEEQEKTSAIRQEANQEMQDVEEVQATEPTGLDERRRERESMTEANLEPPPPSAEQADPPETTDQLNNFPDKTFNTEFKNIHRPHEAKGLKRTPMTLNFKTRSSSLLSTTEGRPKREKRFQKDTESMTNENINHSAYDGPAHRLDSKLKNVTKLFL